jgi:enoyl-CoA hydratase/carnithine racemase
VSTSDSPVRFETLGHVALITLDRPQVRNAIDLATAEEISAALDRLDADSAIRVGVLTGAGTVFSAGMDLKAFSASGQRPLTASRGAFGIVARPPEKPLIAAVEGSALGGGLEIALACDLIVAAEDARFGLPEVSRGLVAAAGGVLRLPQRIPRNVAMELVLTAAAISAPEAHRLGLVNRLTASGAAVEEAVALANSIAANAPMAVRTAKQLVLASADWPADEAFARQAPHTDRVRASADAAEGARAFVDKRAPVWTGS